jgi:hypothetical protein
MVPSELASISEPEDKATEYLHYRQFFVIWELLEEVVECQAAGNGGLGLGKEEYTNWVNRYRVIVFGLFFFSLPLCLSVFHLSLFTPPLFLARILLIYEIL